MRLLILILLFPFIAQGQIVRTHPYYKPFAAACTPLLLDTYSGAAAAYSLRKIDCDYAGSAIRVRRSSDNTEQDIGFTSGGDLDTAALKTFVGTGGSDDGFVVTFYDQSGNANNATQSTAGSQSQIMDNGVVIRQNTKPSSYFDGGDFYNISNISAADPWSSFCVFKKNAAGSIGMYLSASANSPFTPIIYTSVGVYISNSSGNYKYNGTYNNTNYIILSGFSVGASSYEVYVNGASVSIPSSASEAATANFTKMGQRGGGEGSTGYFGEFIIYTSNKTSNRTGIESNINTYYSIY